MRGSSSPMRDPLCLKYRGHFAEVRTCTDLETGAKFAIKIIDKKDLVCADEGMRWGGGGGGGATGVALAVGRRMKRSNATNM